MNRRSFRLCLTAVISFIAGFLWSPIAIGVWKAQFVTPVHRQRQKEAYSFFYRTMLGLFEGTYGPENGFISQEAMNIYKKYRDRLGIKCRVHLEEDSAGDFVGEAFFPSGDLFRVEIRRIDECLVLAWFHPEDWDRLLRELRPNIEHDNKQI